MARRKTVAKNYLSQLAPAEREALRNIVAPGHDDFLEALVNLLHTRGRGCQCRAVEAACGPGRKCDECIARDAIANAQARRAT